MSKPYLTTRDDAPAYWLVETLWRLHADAQRTGGAVSLMEQLMPGGMGPPAHFHRKSEEMFFVLQGTVLFHLSGQEIKAGPSTAILLPPGLPHGFEVVGGEAQVLNAYAPAGFEAVVMSLGRPAAEPRRPAPQDSMPLGGEAQIRLLSETFDQHGAPALPFLTPTQRTMLKTVGDPSRPGAVIVQADEASSREVFGSTWRTLLSSKSIGMALVSQPSGSGMPHHSVNHARLIYMLDGVLDATIDGSNGIATTGTSIWLPAGAATQWDATSRSEILLFNLPGTSKPAAHYPVSFDDGLKMAGYAFGEEVRDGQDD